MIFNLNNTYGIFIKFIIIKKGSISASYGTGDEGIEPPLKVLETLVIPFDQSPKSTYQL